MNMQELKNIYGRIQACHVCPNMDKQKMLRRTDAVDCVMDIFIISQALAETTLRKTGVNFFGSQGLPGNTGKLLEEFLNLFSFTIYPPVEIALNDGAVIRARSPHLRSIYNTEITQCYPGKAKNGKGDRIPSGREVLSCSERKFLELEISLIKPKLVLLMGRHARDNFYKQYLHLKYPTKLNDHIEVIVSEGKLPCATVGGHTFYVCPIMHASGQNPYFRTMLRNTDLVSLIIKAITS